MYLKKYQIKVVSAFHRFFEIANQTRDNIEKMKEEMPEEAAVVNWVDNSYSKLNIPYNDYCKNGLGEFYPRVCIKLPTGGGKT